MKNKKALSNVLATILMVVLVIAIMAVVINVVRNTVDEKIDESQSCGPDLVGELSINSQFVCYDSNQDYVVVSVERGNISLSELSISVRMEKEAFRFDITDGTDFSGDNKGAFPFDPNGYIENVNTESVDLPDRNSARTYMIGNITEKPKSIIIAPIVDGEMCQVSDRVSEIADCSRTTIFE